MAIGTVFLGPIILPIYLASRPLKQGEVREGGKGWNILKNFAILWTIVMAIASVAGLMAMTKGTENLTSDAARAGAGIGMALGMGLLAAVWFFPTMGAALLGFLMKKNTVVENGPAGSLVGENSTANAAGGWAGVCATAVVGLIVVGVASTYTTGTGASTAASDGRGTALLASTSNGEWVLTESVNAMDNTAEVILHKTGSAGASLDIRCIKQRTDAYVNTDTVVDNGSVRVKFDESSPIRQLWTRSTDYKALFAPDGLIFARQLAKSKSFLLEFTPFQEGPRTISFDVSGLDTKLQKISDSCHWDVVDKSRAKAKAADAALRERVAEYVHPCNQHIEGLGNWCWTDPYGIIDEEGYKNSREKALEEAVEYKKMGFRRFLKILRQERLTTDSPRLSSKDTIVPRTDPSCPSISTASLTVPKG